MQGDTGLMRKYAVACFLWPFLNFWKEFWFYLAQKLKIIPLGGLDEIGKNLTVLEYGKDIMVVPTSINSNLFNNSLIYQGAVPIISGKDLEEQIK